RRDDGGRNDDDAGPAALAAGPGTRGAVIPRQTGDDPRRPGAGVRADARKRRPPLEHPQRGHVLALEPEVIATGETGERRRRLLARRGKVGWLVHGFEKLAARRA